MFVRRLFFCYLIYDPIIQDRIWLDSVGKTLEKSAADAENVAAAAAIFAAAAAAFTAWLSPTVTVYGYGYTSYQLERLFRSEI